MNGSDEALSGVTRRRPVCVFLGILAGVPVVASVIFLHFMLMESARIGIETETGPDMSAVLPEFFVLYLGPVGIALSVAAIFRRERFALSVLALYLLIAVDVWFHR